MLYDESNPYVGHLSQGQHRRQPQPLERLFLGPELGVEHFTNDGEEVYSGYVFRLKLEAYATGTVWGRLIYDRSSFNDSDAYETLFAWEHSPGSAYIYSESGSTRLIRGTDDQPSPTDGEREDSLQSGAGLAGSHRLSPVHSPLNMEG